MEWPVDDTSPVRRTVLYEQVKEYLLGAILSGALRPGDRVVETQLARHLGVSQAPVREALRQLEQMGVLESEPFRGVSVRSLTARELAEIYHVRAVLEEMAGRLAAGRVTPEDLRELGALADEMVQAAAAGDQRRMVSADVAFHRRIVERSGNGFLLRIWEMIQPATWTMFTAKVARRGLSSLARRHEEILVSLRTLDPDVVGPAMRRHIVELADEIAAGEVDLGGRVGPAGPSPRHGPARS